MHNESDQGGWRLRSDVVTTVLQDGGVILDLRSKYFFSANSTALAIVQMFETGTSIAEVLQATVKWGATGDAPAVRKVIDQIVSEGLVEQAGRATGNAPDVAVTTWILPVLSKHNEPLQRIMVSA